MKFMRAAGSNNTAGLEREGGAKKGCRELPKKPHDMLVNLVPSN